MAPLKPAERMDFFLQLEHPLRNTLLDKYQSSHLQGFQNLRDPKTALDQLMARILTSNYPTEVVFQMPQPPLPFFFIDELTTTRILLNVNRRTIFARFIGILHEASAGIAAQIKNNAHFLNDRTRGQLSATRFSWDDGPYLSRIVTVTQGPGGQELVARSEWTTVYASAYRRLFNGPHALQFGSSVEIQHTLQHFRNISAVRSGPPPPPLEPRRLAGTASSDIPFPLPGQGHHPATHTHPYPAPRPAPLPSRALPFYFIDEPSGMRIQLPVYPNTSYTLFTSHLEATSRDVARQVENYTSDTDPSFSTETGQWVARSITLNSIRGDAGGVTSSAWFVVSHHVYYWMLEQALSGSAIAVEIEHALQYTHDTDPVQDFDTSRSRSQSRPGDRRRGESAPAPSSHQSFFEETRRGSHSAQDTRGQLPLPDPTPPPTPLSVPAPSPPPPSPLVGRPVVRLPPAFAPVVAPLRAVPVSSTSMAGVVVVDGGDLAWYKREEELRGWLRFGSAEVVESLDVWSGW
ncbi:hypothetical protein PV04_05398 [Phialophora macrospora]|uniref:Uncharacterized protein n=1 Tax=Phialophora macrospora TaxID=1851006 RepID=A0A0D2FSN0_9EURO|nr:hypothetical protein PV04_05398 [Phialophora macrospora]